MPHGISGLLIAAIFAAAMSNLSAALNSLSSTTIVDFYMRHRPGASERRRVLLSRVATIVWGLVLFALAILSRRGGKVVEVGLSIASVAYGALLGVFLLGVLTRRANERGSMIGMPLDSSPTCTSGRAAWSCHGCNARLACLSRPWRCRGPSPSPGTC